MARFADRDWIMRFRGGGVGHRATRTATNKFKKDRHRLDISNKSDDAMEVDEEQAEQGGLDSIGENLDAEVDENELEDYGYAHASASEDEELGDEQEQGGEDEGGSEEEDDGEQGELEQLGFADL
jgi:hypothetical protein